jgi:hypothetical protein
LHIPEIAAAVFAHLDTQASLRAAALVCRGWAPMAIDRLWRDPPAAALASVTALRRPIYAAAIRALHMRTADAVHTALGNDGHDDGGWTFPHLRRLGVDFEVVEDQPHILQELLARAGGSSDTLRSVTISGGPADGDGDSDSGAKPHLDTSYDTRLAGVLAVLAPRQGLTELLFFPPVTENLRLPNVAASDAALSTEEDNVRSQESRDTKYSTMFQDFVGLRSLHINVAATGGYDATPSCLPFLCPTLFGTLTSLEMSLDDAGSNCGYAVEAASRLSALSRLLLTLPYVCYMSVAQFATLGRLAQLRHLGIKGGQWGIGVHLGTFPDAVWARMVAGWPHLRTLGIEVQCGLSARALGILGAACRELDEVYMSKHDVDILGLPAVGDDDIIDLGKINILACDNAGAGGDDDTVDENNDNGDGTGPNQIHNSNAYNACGGRASSAGGEGCSSSGTGNNVLFPRLTYLLMHSTGLQQDGTPRNMWSERFLTTAVFFGGYSRHPRIQTLACALAARLRRHAPKLARFRFADYCALEGAVQRCLAPSATGAGSLFTGDADSIYRLKAFRWYAGRDVGGIYC